MHTTDDPSRPALNGIEGLKRAVYVSKASPDHGPEMLADILRTSRLKNRAAGITGLLVYFEGRFLQYLEGPGLAVYGTLGLIKDDPRHRHMEILLDEATDRRLFDSWDMGCLDVGSEAWLKLVQADWPTMRLLRKDSPSGLTVLQEIAQQPLDAPEQPRLLGGGRREGPLATADEAPELRFAKLQIVGLALFALLMVLLIFRVFG